MKLKYHLLFLFCILESVSFSQTDRFKGLKYRSLGPYRGGRSTAVCGMKNDVNTYYMGSTGGGVWKTENQGKSWQNISDGFFGGSIGCVTIAPSDDNVVYVGQGEESLRGNVSRGAGVWKSEDAGKTWKFKGLKTSAHITKIVIHPTNSDIVFAAVLGDLFKDTKERGLYKSINGGDTWEKVLFISSNVGCNDVEIDPFNYRIMYSSFWKVRRTPYSFSSGGEGCGVWKSIDGGNTWKQITKNKGLPKGLLGKITISSSAAKRDLVYLMVEHKTKGGLYKSVDAGATWLNINSDAKIRQRAWYFSKVIAHPKDASIVYVLNVRFQKSVDGGKTFSRQHTPHVDHHGLWINPKNPKNMIVANDGGGQVSSNAGITWSSYHNQSTSQFYRVSTDNAVPYLIYGAQQDNSTVRINHLSARWTTTAGGESAHIAPDPRNPQIVYAGNYDGYLTRFNHTTRESRAINVWPDNPMGHGAEDMKYRFNWNFPLFFSQHDSSKLYAFSNKVHVSFNGGNSWDIISPDLTKNEKSKMIASGGPITKDNTGVEYYGTILCAEESPSEKDVIYVGTDDGRVQITQNNGISWQDITPKGIPEYVQINSLDASREKGTVLIAATNYKNGDYTPYLFITTNYGKSWTKIIDGIASTHFTRVVRQDLKNSNILYCGTEAGMYISFSKGMTWQSFQLNLPIVPITDIVQKENDLIVATQGRSMWIIDHLGLIRSYRNNTNLQAFQVESMARTAYASCAIPFFITDSTWSNFTIEIVDNTGELVKVYSTKKGKDTTKIKLTNGLNTVYWNLRYKGIDKPKDMILWWSSLGGPKAKLGKYTVRYLLENKLLVTQDFQIFMDPNSEAKIDDYQKQFEYLLSLRDKVNEIHKTIKEIKDAKEQIEYLSSKNNNFASYPKIDSLSKGLIHDMDSIVNDLYQTKNKSRQDPINYPIKLNNKLTHLNTLVGMGNYAPTQQAIKVKNNLTQKVDERLVFYNSSIVTRITALNDLIKKTNIQIIKIK